MRIRADRRSRAGPVPDVDPGLAGHETEIRILVQGRKDPAAVSLGRRGGLKGSQGVSRGSGEGRQAHPEQRSAIARKAAEARWG